MAGDGIGGQEGNPRQFSDSTKWIYDGAGRIIGVEFVQRMLLTEAKHRWPDFKGRGCLETDSPVPAIDW